MNGRTALVLGATGLVGRHCVDELLRDQRWRQVRALVRRPLGVEHPRLVVRIADFEDLEAHADGFAVDDVFCCLGTTIAKAGSREAFRRVDLAYPLHAARIAHRQGARRFLLVSAVGADANSRVFYNRVKGELEEALRAVGFEHLVIAQPSLLLGERLESRRGERIAELALRVARPLLRGPLRRYRAVEARAVARALVRLSRDAAPGVTVVASDRLAVLGAPPA